MSGPWAVDIPLVGAGGEPVDFRRTVRSHGCASLPPGRMRSSASDGCGRGEPVAYEVTLPLPGTPFGARRVLLTAAGHRRVGVAVDGPPPRAEERGAVLAATRRLLRLDDDLTGFYALAVHDAELRWAVRGAGRLIRSPTVFEDVVKTLCTTNCSWSATERMVAALVEHLGEPAVGVVPEGPYGRAFPTPAAMAGAGPDFYRDVVRAGYRGRYLHSLATRVSDGDVDLEALDADAEPRLTDDEVERRLLTLPGIGPYAAAHVMLLLGRYSRVILDSWTRPTYARRSGRAASDSGIRRRFARYGRWRGLACWLYLTRGWVSEP